MSDSAANAGTQPGAYTVKANDTLQRISQMVFGDSRYWYLIADANGLSPSDALVEGKTLVIPNQHTQTYNSAESFKPYNESEVLGDVNPDPIAPPPPRKICNPVASIIMTVFAVVISIYLPAASGFVGAMLKGAAVSIGTQLVGKALGVIDEFSWKQVALSAVTGGVLKELGLDKLESLSQTQTAIASAAVGYATNYVGSKALGMDVSFSWKNIAGAVGGALVGGQLKQAGLIDTGNQIVDDTLLGFAADISDTAIRGDSVSDNVAQIGLDAFGNALSNGISRAEAHKTMVEHMDAYETLQSKKAHDEAMYKLARQMEVNRLSLSKIEYQNSRKGINFLEASKQRRLELAKVRSQSSDSSEAWPENQRRYSLIERMNGAFASFEANPPLLAEKFGRQSMPRTAYEVSEGIIESAASATKASLVTSTKNFIGWDPYQKIGTKFSHVKNPSFTSPALRVITYDLTAANGARLGSEFAGHAVRSGGVT
ncbi:LysM peptidoglycan-binding domain-containing protein [Vibrio sp. Isolate25]|uniref:LysM peptidoglycan-binding domain-containing protein n=1 Tax=Vibrio sp. Isolate25 TaxID=2908535 RepID=UPI001EFCADD9|nr:LysM peptidoglycan-binding domain-containing protein [Vibrio sp. Isolate25]MCG9598004.1 LysM peptidoglycan-binding domain-containing protein [Vibrio sp. Isolate25]